MVNIAKNFLIMWNNLQQMQLNILQKKFIQKTAEATGDLIGNKIANEIKKLSKNSRQNNSETVKYKHDKEIPKARYVSSEEKQEIIDGLYD